MTYAYLCSPYTAPDPETRQARFDSACRVAARLMRSGVVVFSPIAHSHPIEAHFGEIKDFEFWMAQDLPILMRSAKVYVLRLEGWDKSRGIQRELEVAAAFGIPVEYIDP